MTYLALPCLPMVDPVTTGLLDFFFFSFMLQPGGKIQLSLNLKKI